MNIKVFNDFSYRVSPSFQEEMIEDIRQELMDFDKEFSPHTVTVRFQDELHPNNSKKRFFRCSLTVHGNKNMPKVVTSKRSVRIAAALGQSLQAIRKRLERLQERSLRSRKRKQIRRRRLMQYDEAA